MPFSVTAEFETKTAASNFAVPNIFGQIMQGLPIAAKAINDIRKGPNPDGTTSSTVTYQPPQVTAPAVVNRPFTIAGLLDTIRNNPLPALAVVALLGFVVWKATK